MVWKSARQIIYLKNQTNVLRSYSCFTCPNMIKRFVSNEKTLASDQNIIRSSYPDVEIPNIPLHEYVFDKFGQRETKVAVKCERTKKNWTFKDIYRTSKATANSLLNKLKLEKGNHFAIVLPNGAEHPILLLAGSMSGLVPTTINPSYTATEILYQLKDSDSRAIFTVMEIYEKIKEALNTLNSKIPVVIVKNHPSSQIPAGAVSFDDLTEYSSAMNFRPVAVEPKDVVVLPYSSGTSGLPKGVKLTHRNIIANLLQFRSINGFMSSGLEETNQDSVLGILPMFHIYGMVTITLNCISEGSRLISLPGFEPKLFVQSIATEKVQILYLVPPLVFFLCNTPAIEPKHLKSVEHIIVGAAPCGGSDLEKLSEKIKNVKICQGYGMTETSPVITISHKDRCHKMSSAGHPVPSTLIKVADVSTGQALPQGKLGEICVKGPQVMEGYLNRPEESKNIFDSEGWLKTGDVGYCDEEKDFYIVDRIKELIKVKSFQVAPAELEEFIRSHPKVADVGVIGVKHSLDGEVPKAFVVIKPGVCCTEEEIKNYVGQNLSSYKQIKGGVEFVKEIPKSGAGKILRKNLRDFNKENS